MEEELDFLVESLPKTYNAKLNEVELAQVAKCVPLHQAQIHYSFKGSVLYQNEQIKNAAIAISEHLITICSTSKISKEYKARKIIHLLEILNLKTNDNNNVTISIGEESLIIKSPFCMRFVRTILRNFLLAIPLMPPKMRFPLACHNPKFFPPFFPNLSPSQSFQFTYNTFCSFFETAYTHDVTNYFHNNIRYNFPIFDFSNLPFHLIEAGVGESIDVRPITSALMYCPYISGFVSNGISRPDIIKGAAPIVAASKTLSLLQLRNAKATTGGTELGKALKSNKESKLSYLDISGNKLEDIRSLIVAMAHIKTHIKGLIMDDCNVPVDALEALFDSFENNKAFHYLESFSLLNSKIPKNLIDSFSSALLGMSHLKELSLSNVALIGVVLNALKESRNKLITLHLTNTTFTPQDAQELGSLVNSMKSLVKVHLESCTLGIDNLVEIAHQLTSHNITLQFTKMKLNGASLNRFIDAIPDENANNVVSLGLESNDINEDDLAVVKAKFSKLNGLKIGGNSLSAQSILELGTELEALDFSNVKNTSTTAALLKGISEVGKLKKLILNDTQFNLGVFEALISVIENCPLISLSINNTGTSDTVAFKQLFAAIKQSKTLCRVALPFEDFFRLSDSSEIAESVRLMNLSLQNNRRVLKASYFDDIVMSSIASKLQERMISLQIDSTVHSSLADLVGVPLPFESIGMPLHEPLEITKLSDEVSQNDSADQAYVDPLLFAPIQEQPLK